MKCARCNNTGVVFARKRGKAYGDYGFRCDKCHGFWKNKLTKLPIWNSDPDYELVTAKRYEPSSPIEPLDKFKKTLYVIFEKEDWRHPRLARGIACYGKQAINDCFKEWKEMIKLRHAVKEGQEPENSISEHSGANPIGET